MGPTAINNSDHSRLSRFAWIPAFAGMTGGAPGICRRGFSTRSGSRQHSFRHIKGLKSILSRSKTCAYGRSFRTSGRSRLSVLPAKAGMTERGPGSELRLRAPGRKPGRDYLDDRAIVQVHLPVLGIFLSEHDYGPGPFLARLQKPGFTRDQYVLQARPVFFVVVGDQRNMGVCQDVAHPAQLPERRGLGLGVQYRVDRLTVEDIANRYDLGPAFFVGGGQMPGARRAKKPVLGGREFCQNI